MQRMPLCFAPAALVIAQGIRVQVIVPFPAAGPSMKAFQKTAARLKGVKLTPCRTVAEVRMCNQSTDLSQLQLDTQNFAMHMLVMLVSITALHGPTGDHSGAGQRPEQEEGAAQHQHQQQRWGRGR